MKNILLVIDMQNGFARNTRTKDLTKKITDLLQKGIFDYVVATRFLNEDNSSYERLFGWENLKTKEEQQIPEEIGDYVDCVFDKYIYNCVNPNFIQKLCQLNDGNYPKRVFLVGADTDCCVLSIATALFENNIRPIVLTNYCDSNGGEESHKAGILCMKRLIGRKQLYGKDIFTKEDLKNI